MGSTRARSSAIVAMLFGLVGPGCIHVHTDEEGRLRSVEMSLTDTVAAKKPTPRPTGDVKQVSAMTPSAAAPAPTEWSPAPPAAASSSPPIGSRLATLRPSFPKFTSLMKPTATPIAEVTALWQNRIAHLPDPTRNGAAGAGLAGELFLIGAGPRMPFAEADGKVTFTIYDESRGAASSTPLGTWTFEKEVLERLLTVDERLGKCYAVFLPWPDYKPTISRVRLTTRYDPENGHPLFATTWVTFDDGSSSIERAASAMSSMPISSVPAVTPPGPTTTVPAPTTGPVAPPAAAPQYTPAFPAPIPLNGTAAPSVLPPQAPIQLPPPTILPARP